jgi:hypothetical protein
MAGGGNCIERNAQQMDLAHQFHHTFVAYLKSFKTGPKLQIHQIAYAVYFGGLAEWFKVAAYQAEEPAMVPGVRIPHPIGLGVGTPGPFFLQNNIVE